jgi:hypothetical protein
MTSRVSPKECSLHLVLGEHERCPGADCAFWESPDGCTIERLELAALGHQELARHLLELRERLEAARTEEERREAPKRLAELLNLNRE